MCAPCAHAALCSVLRALYTRLFINHQRYVVVAYIRRTLFKVISKCGIICLKVTVRLRQAVHFNNMFAVSVIMKGVPLVKHEGKKRVGLRARFDGIY